MYKTSVFFILVIIGGTCAFSSFDTKPKKLQRSNTNFGEKKVGIDVCPECIEEAVTIINMLLNLVLDEGIIQSCDALCGALANKTGSEVIGDMCDVVCASLGVDEFVRLIIKEDLDPIWYCEIIDLCPGRNIILLFFAHNVYEICLY